MDDDLISQFVAITNASEERAHQYLSISEQQLEQAIELFYNTNGADLGASVESTAPQTANRLSAADPSRQGAAADPISLDSDEEIVGEDDVFNNGEEDDDVELVATSARQPRSSNPQPRPINSSFDDDAEMARRMQEEMYAESGGGPTNVDAEGYRAPIARTRGALLGPDSFDPNDPDEMRAAMLEQMQRRQMMRGRNGAPGIFNQQSNPSIWNTEPGGGGSGGDGGGGSSSSNADGMTDHAQALAQATGGASRASSKTTMLAEMYRPPFELMSRLSWEDARTEGRDDKRWLLVNIQDTSIFDCQLLNRDIWKDPGVVETVREHFIFLQYTREDPRAQPYVQYYFQQANDSDAYPHIAIVDPRTGEQVKRWSGPPAPKAGDFLMQLHEFLDRYSLDATAKNPVAKRRAEPPAATRVDRMSEEQQLEMAMQASLAQSHASGSASASNQRKSGDDPDELTRSVDELAPGVQRTSNVNGNGSSGVSDPASTLSSTAANGLDATQSNSDSSTKSLFASISSSNPHTEPAANEPGTTRIQFRHPNGRIVRRFALNDPVRRIYEWLKATPLEDQPSGSAGSFELVAMGHNLLDRLDDSIDVAGLKNGTVMVEFVES